MIKISHLRIIVLFIVFQLIFQTVSHISIAGVNEINLSQTTMSGKIYYVGGQGPGNFSKIQNAIDYANSGDTVFVYDDSSPYNENIHIDKTIRLIGEDKNTTTIDGRWEDNVIYVTADEVIVNSFTLLNGKPGWYYAAVKIESASSIGIYQNIIKNCEYGVLIYQSDGGHNISENIMFDCRIGVDCELGAPHDNSFLNNVLVDMDWGFCLEGSRNNRIIGNSITECHTAIEFGGGQNIISYNEIADSEFGLYLLTSNGNTIAGNILRNNRMAITLERCQENRIYWNIIDHSEAGFQVFASRYNEIFENNITNNFGLYRGGGIRLYVSSRNEIFRNNFINNIPNAWTANAILYMIMNFGEFGLADLRNHWDQNYWNVPRQYPYPVFVRVGLWFAIIPFVNFDWHPASKPYDIGGNI